MNVLRVRAAGAEEIVCLWRLIGCFRGPVNFTVRQHARSLPASNRFLERSVIVGSVAADAGRQCAPAAAIGGFSGLHR